MQPSSLHPPRAKPALSSPPTGTNDPIASALARWRATVEAELKGAPFDKKLVTRTPEGVALRPLYTRADRRGLRELDARPGQAPFLRGVRPLGYKTAPWQVAQEIAADSPAEFNAALRLDPANGQNAIVLTPDAASRAGRDPDGVPPVTVEAGAGGLSLATVGDFAAALAGVDLTAQPLYLATGADVLPLATLYLEYARSRGTPWVKLTGAVSADPLGEWMATGALPAGLPALYDSLAGWTTWAQTYLPSLKTIGVNATAWGDAGGTATQELAFALAAAVEYLRALRVRGMSAADAAARIDFRFAIGGQFFTEIAKFRAFRPLWARVVTAFHGEPAVAGLASVRAATGRWDKTLLDPHVNLLRVTTEALSAVLGGCDGLHIAPFDEVTGATTEFSRRVARNVHVLLAEEFNFAEVADPAGGSWYLEKLTDEIARQAWALFQDIESRGGLAAALRANHPQQLVAKAAAEKRDGVARRRIGIVGTNLFPNLKETPLAIRARPTAAPATKIPDAPAAAPGRGDWMARFSAALSLARAGGSVGQWSRLARRDDATEAAIAPVRLRRAAADFEVLRAASAAFAVRTGARPRVFLAKIGPVAQHKARADFSAGFFAVGGFEALAKQRFETAGAAAQAALESGAPIAVLCSTDETYPALVPAFAGAVKTANPKAIVVLAGWPADEATTAAYRAAGVDEFIHLRANVCELLAQFQQQIGAIA